MPPAQSTKNLPGELLVNFCMYGYIHVHQLFLTSILLYRNSWMAYFRDLNVMFEWPEGDATDSTFRDLLRGCVRVNPEDAMVDTRVIDTELTGVLRLFILSSKTATMDCVKQQNKSMEVNI